MTKVRMQAGDTMHVSSVGPENIAAGDQFEVSEVEAKQLEQRGLAKRVGAKMEKTVAANKMEPAPANKATSAIVKKDG